jgi:serine/threonine-protein phosphatase 2A activator
MIVLIQWCASGCKLYSTLQRVSKGVKSALDMLDRVEELAKTTPPVDNKASRFGNPAFKSFYDKVQEVCGLGLPVASIMSLETKQVSPALHESILELSKEATEEVSVYFNECWGNRSRIDYGSGMELNFLCWM